jgi:hypothetical protein
VATFLAGLFVGATVGALGMAMIACGAREDALRDQAAAARLWRQEQSDREASEHLLNCIRCRGL